MLGLRNSLITSRNPGITIVTDNLVLRHDYRLHPVQPLSDGAAYFDGTDDYIQVSNSDNLGTSDASFSFWVNCSDFTNATFLAKFQDNSNRILFITDGSDQFLTQGRADGSYGWNTSFEGALTSYENQWVNISVTIDRSGNVISYVNGASYGSADISSGSSINVDNTGDWFFGQYGGGTFFDGYMCNVGYWNVALTQAQIKSIMWKDYAGLSASEKTNLVSWWNLDSVIPDTTTLVYDNHHGDGDTLGDEILINGDFSDTTSTDTTSAALTGWTNGGTHNGANKFTISDGQLTCITDGTDSYITSTQTLTLGVTYKLTLDYVSGDVGVSWYSGGSLGTISTVGTHTIYYTAVNTAIIIDNTTAGTFTVDNISVKQVNGNTGTLS